MELPAHDRVVLVRPLDETFAVVFLALSCIGTKGVKEEKITWAKIHCSLAAGVVLFS